MKTAFFVASAVLALTVSAPAQAQIKAGIAPKPWSVIKAERAAKAEREEQRLAGKSEQRHDQAFAKMDTNGDGRISPEEYRAAGAMQEAQEDHLGDRNQRSQ